MVVRTYRDFLRQYGRLGCGDAFIGQMGGGSLRPAMLVDSMHRGIRCYPSALAQILHHSKTAQAFLLGAFMLPETRVISRRSELLAAVGEYADLGIGAVVTKQNHMHCGHGVRKWESVEILYNLAGLVEESYPFVLQPFLESFADIRVIIAGSFQEAYRRSNPAGFRMNLAAGGISSPHDLTAEQHSFCRQVMDRAGFPFAHIDLHVTGAGEIFLSEISLGGGIKGASVERKELERIKAEVLERLAAADGVK